MWLDPIPGLVVGSVVGVFVVVVYLGLEKAIAHIFTHMVARIRRWLGF
jgi:hypothetical protein